MTKIRAGVVLWVFAALAMLPMSGCQDVCPENTHGPEDCPEPVDDDHDNLPEPDNGFSPQEIDFCTCMLFECHDEFHGTYGDGDVEARDNCLLEISSLPEAGAPATSGNVQECRVHFCETDAERNCQAALGNAVCE